MQSRFAVCWLFVILKNGVEGKRLSGFPGGTGNCAFYHGGYGVCQCPGNHGRFACESFGDSVDYTGAIDQYYEAVQGWMQKHHNFTLAREWFLECSGVIPAIHEMLAAWTSPGGGILILTPVYNPFRISAAHAGCFLSESEFIKTEDTYEINWADSQEKAADPRITVCILCSPHNRIGRYFGEKVSGKLYHLYSTHQDI